MASDLLHPLNRAVKREDAFEVRRLLDAGCDVHACDSRGVAPVLIAADRGNTNVLRPLLDAGADPNTPWPGGWTPLVRAAFAGSRGAVALLLDRGAEPWVQMEVDNRQSVAGLTPVLARTYWDHRTARACRERRSQRPSERGLISRAFMSIEGARPPWRMGSGVNSRRQAEWRSHIPAAIGRAARTLMAVWTNEWHSPVSR
jgi:hypothetical protein